jgi:hypothetical protein
MGSDAHPRGVMTRSRFDSLESAREPAKAGPSTATEERFGRDEDDALRLAVPDAGEQPFRRCPRCQRDATRFETVCASCDTGLDTPEARAFNDALWKERQQHEALSRADQARRAADQQSSERAQAELLQQARVELGQDLKRDLGGTRPSVWRRLGRAVVGLALFELAASIHVPVLQVLLGAAGVGCLVAALPASVWRQVSERSRFGRW